MTVQEALDWFDILQDKFGSPYFNETQKLVFLNNAQNEYLNSLFPGNEGGLINLENDFNVIQNISPLIWEMAEVNMDVNGKVTEASLVTALQSLTGDSDTDIFKIINIEFKKGAKRYQCKALRHNDKSAFESNYFKKPSLEAPRYLLQNNNIQFRPVDQATKVIFTVVKKPAIVSTSPPVEFDFPASTHNEIVAYGLQFAGIASRDEVLSAMNAAQLPKMNG